MDPVLADVYSTALTSAPFVIAAYALIWVIVLAFVIAMIVKSRKTDKDISALRDAVERLERKRDEGKGDVR